MIVLAFARRLSAESWAATLKQLPLLSASEWPTNLDGSELCIDLSAVGFADFVTLGQLLIFIDTVTARGAAVSVRLPNAEPLDGEDPHDHEAARRRRQRQSCRLFLSQSGFEDALAAGPWPESAISILEGQADALTSQMSDRPVADRGTIEEPNVPHRLRKVVRYQWIAPPFGAELTGSSHILALENALHGLGLPSEDSAALAKGVLAELIENVAEHAQRSPERPIMALVGAAVVWPQVYATRVNDFAPKLREFIRWAAEVGSPLVRLVVADSGRGVTISHQDEQSNPQQAILQAFDRRIATVTPGADFRPNLRGLWKVQRIVRGYQGSMLIATNGVVAGRVFADSPEGRDVTDEASAWLPGVFVECNILARPHDVAQSDEEVLTPVRQRTGRRTTVACADVTLRPGRALDLADRKEISDILTGPRAPEDTGLVIVVDTLGGDEPDDSDIRAFLGDILRAAREPAQPPNLAVVFPSINRRLLSLAVEAVNAEHGSQDDGPYASERLTPILLVAPEHRHYWLGGTRHVRQMLRLLSSTAGAVPLDILVARIGSDPDHLEAIQQLRDATIWLRKNAELLSLRLRPQDAIDTMVSDLADKLTRAIELGDSPGALSGTFLTPSLRLTTRWYNLGEILTHMHAERRAGFALAAKVEARLGRFDGLSSPPSILQVGTATHQFMSSFARGTTGATQYFDSVHSLRTEHVRREVGTPTQVLLVTDLVSTGTTLAHTVSELMSHDLEAVAVATTVDARTTAVRQTEEMVFRELRLPLVTLTSVDIEPAPGSVRPADVDPIDPVLRRPGGTAPQPPHVLVLQSEYIDALIRTGAARLGHIERPASRHYTAHVDPTMLFRDRDWSLHVTRRATTKIADSHRQVFMADAASAPICILYPTETGGDLEQVAHRLREILQRNDMQTTDVVPVPRAALGTQWLYPPSVPVPPAARHIVFVDAASGTGRSAHQLIRLAATSHVEAITGVILLNGLRDLDARALQHVRMVARLASGATQSAPAIRHDIPVELHFMARTAVSSMDARDCPVCDLRRGYANLALLAPVPPQIEQQRDWLTRSLEPRSKQRVFQEEPTDLLGAHISQEDCVRYLRWRFDLREAASSTPRRRDVVEEINRATEDPDRRDALVRLLTAERQWLKSAPLWFPEVHTRVANMAASMLVAESAASIDPVLRVQAVILLANMDPRTLVDQLRSIMRINSDQPLVLGQVMLELLRLTTGHDESWPHPRDLLLQDLTRKLIDFEHELWENARRPVAEMAPISLSEVRYLISHGRRILQPVPTDPQGAWATLRSYRQKVIDHNYDNPMWRLLQTLRNLGRGVRPESPEKALDDWRRCSDVLTLRVMPSVRLLRLPLLSTRITSRLLPDDAIRWEQVLNGNGPRDLDKIDIQLNVVLDHREASPPAAPHSVEELHTDLSFWNRFFLGTHPQPGKPNAALLIEIVERCPVELFEVIESAFEDAKYEVQGMDAPGIRRTRVFATADLLNDVFTHIRRNAEETHRTPSDAASPATSTGQRFFIDVRIAERDRITVAVRNTCSAASITSGGKGLEALAAELSGFGAYLEPEAITAPDLTYGIRVNLERWRMI
jgi:orotate phosphoribosyltransferase